MPPFNMQNRDEGAIAACSAFPSLDTACINLDSSPHVRSGAWLLDQGGVAVHALKLTISDINFPD